MPLDDTTANAIYSSNLENLRRGGGILGGGVGAVGGGLLGHAVGRSFKSPVGRGISAGVGALGGGIAGALAGKRLGALSATPMTNSQLRKLEETLAAQPVPQDDLYGVMPPAYLEGYKDAAAKFAGSRWREAIRSGEVMGPAAETLKTQMGVDPLREASGLATGWANKARASGYTSHVLSSPWQTFKGAIGRVFRRKGAPPLTGMLGARMSGSPALVHPFSQSTLSFPHKNLGLLKDVGGDTAKQISESPKLLEQFQGSVLGHEGSELSALGRMGGLRDPMTMMSRGYMPVDATEQAFKKMYDAGGGLARRVSDPSTRFLLGQRSLYQNAAKGSHASPQVLLEEIRNNRMLSPEIQSFWKQTRNLTGELPAIEAVTGTAGRLAKKNLPSLSRAILKNNNVGRFALEQAFEEGAKRTPFSKLRELISNAGGAAAKAGNTAVNNFVR